MLIFKSIEVVFYPTLVRRIFFPQTLAAINGIFQVVIYTFRQHSQIVENRR